MTQTQTAETPIVLAEILSRGGEQRTRHQILADGTWRERRESLRWDPATRTEGWGEGGWLALDRRAVLAATRSSMTEGVLWRELTPDGRTVVATRYGITLTTLRHACRVCRRAIAAAGLCDGCGRDEHPR